MEDLFPVPFSLFLCVSSLSKTHRRVIWKKHHVGNGQTIEKEREAKGKPWREGMDLRRRDVLYHFVYLWTTTFFFLWGLLKTNYVFKFSYFNTTRQHKKNKVELLLYKLMNNNNKLKNILQIAVGWRLFFLRGIKQ